MTTYRTFLRSARNFEEFSSARKRVQDRGLSIADAQQRCIEYNTRRSTVEIHAGTKLEFESED